MRQESDVLLVDFPGCLQREFPHSFDLVWKATEEIVDAIRGQDLSPLARRSPGLEGYDWSGYLRCSAARLVRVVELLRERDACAGRAADIGSYFGNGALVLQRLGLDTEACDSYAAYEGCLDAPLDVLRAAGGRVRDTGQGAVGLGTLPDGYLDVITCLGVVEHVAHTPKFLLQEIHRLLRPGGTVILDTPNIAYIHRRWQLSRGESVHPPIASQFHSPVPFEGHHREYTGGELVWMLREVGFVDVELETFDYSRLALSELSGITLEGFRVSEADPTARELLLAVATRPPQ